MSHFYSAPQYPAALGQTVTGGYGKGEGVVTYAVADRYLVKWEDGASTWQARWTLKRSPR